MTKDKQRRNSSSFDESSELKFVDFGTQKSPEPEKEFSTSQDQTTTLTVEPENSKRKFDVHKAIQCARISLRCDGVTVLVLVIVGLLLDIEYVKYVLVLATCTATHVFFSYIMLITNSCCYGMYNFQHCAYIGSAVLFLMAVVALMAILTDFDDNIDNDDDLKIYLLVVAIVLLLLSGFKFHVAGYGADTKATELNTDKEMKQSPGDTGGGEFEIDEELGLEDSVRTETLSYDIIGQTGD